MAACGHYHSVVVNEDGEVWAWGAGEAGQLGIGSQVHKSVPTFVGGAELFRSRVVQAAAGAKHTAAVTADGKLFSWGGGCLLGTRDVMPRLTPTELERDVFRGFPVAMVACGSFHTVVQAGRKVFTWGQGHLGQLGLGDLDHRLVPVLVPGKCFDESPIVFVAACANFSLALSDDGVLWTWGEVSYNISCYHVVRVDVCSPYCIPASARAL